MTYLRQEAGFMNEKRVFTLILLSKLKKSFFYKTKKLNHPVLSFNNIQVNHNPYQKHFNVVLHDQLNFGEHLKYSPNKVNKFIQLLSKLETILPRE